MTKTKLSPIELELMPADRPVIGDFSYEFLLHFDCFLFTTGRRRYHINKDCFEAGFNVARPARILQEII